ncbi:hypothetical protein D5b_00310 [Faustovirus]|nr:hypothetical protein D5b_00310 [Faustovirus]AMN84604.1 hypothetical protein D6_00199 [Faustovirus]
MGNPPYVVIIYNNYVFRDCMFTGVHYCITIMRAQNTVRPA